MSNTIRPGCCRWAAALVSATSLLWLTSGASAPRLGLAARSASVTPATELTPPSSTGASDVSNLGSGGWEVQSSAVATQSGAQISTPGFSTRSWLPVSNDDAGAPGTEIEALAQNGKCPGGTALQPVTQGSSGPSSVFFSANMQSCYGFVNSVGADSVARFDVPWWWRTDFTQRLQRGQAATLIINGVIGSAKVWVNGRQVATPSTVTGAVLDDQTASNITLASQQVRTKVLTPKVPTGRTVQAYFVELQLKRGGTLLDRNVYWLSTQPDAVNWGKSLGQPQGVISTYANLKSLQTLPRSSVSATAATASQHGPGGANRATTVTITNTSASTVAFLLRADVRRGTASGQQLPGDNELQSSIWRSNDITLFPGESQTLTVTWNSADLQGATPVVSVSGWNVPRLDIAAP